MQEILQLGSILVGQLRSYAQVTILVTTQGTKVRKTKVT